MIYPEEPIMAQVLVVFLVLVFLSFILVAEFFSRSCHCRSRGYGSGASADRAAAVFYRNRDFTQAAIEEGGRLLGLLLVGTITVGSCAVFSRRSYICTGSHDYTKPNLDIYAEATVIGAQPWLATEVFVALGAEMGEGTVMGARSLVFK
jgi:hypothetical protein